MDAGPHPRLADGNPIPTHLHKLTQQMLMC